MKKGLRNICFLVVILFTANFVSAQKIQVSGEIGQVKRGKINQGKIFLRIPKTLHINANKPLTEFASPTSLTLSAPRLNSFRITYPRGIKQTFVFSKTPLFIFKGKTTINFSFYLPVSNKVQNFKIKAIVSYQTCSDEVCYEPRTEEITLFAKIL